MPRVFWVVPLFGAGIGGLIILWTLVAATSAPQETAGFAMAVAFAVIPYCFILAVEKMDPPGQVQPPKQESRRKPPEKKEEPSVYEIP